MAVVADELLLVVKSNVTQALAGLQAVETKAAGLGGKVKSGVALASKALLGVGAVAAGVAVVSGKMAMDFGKDMAQIEALVGVPKDEMEELRGAALDMGKQFGVSAGEAAGGLFFLKSAGLDTATAIETLEATAKASAIGLGEMEDLANTATTAMTNFGIDSTQAFDSIAMAAKLAKADPSELGRIMNQNSAGAQLVNMSYEDMAATLALLTRKFGDSRKAGTGMEGIIRKLIKPSAMATDMLDQIGVSAADFQKILAEDLPGGLAQLDKAFAESGVSQSEWLGKVFEDGEAIKAAAAVISTSGSEIEEVYGGMAQAQGTLEKGWGIMEETAAVKFDKMKEGIKSALIPIGDVVLTVVVPAITKLVEWLGTGIEWIKQVITSVQGLGLSFEPVIGVLGRLGEVWASIWAYLGPVVEDAVAFVKEIVSGFVDFFNEYWPLISSVIITVLELIQRVWNRIWDAIKDHIMPIWEAIKKIIEGVINVIKGIIVTVMAVIKGDWGKAWDGIKMILIGVWDAIKGVVTGAWEILKTVFDLGIAAIQSAWDVFWTFLGESITGIWQGIVDGVKWGINGIIGYIEGLINGAIAGINALITLANKVPGINIGTIGNVVLPRLAQGGNILKGGMALVGERGPEVLSLPKGASVTPLDKAQGGPQTIIVQLGDEEFARFTLDRTGLSSMRTARRQR